MKPIYEQEWSIDADDTHHVVDANGETVAQTGSESDAHAIAAAPDMARTGMLLHARVAEAARSLPSAKTAEALAEMDTSITVPSSVIREVFAALRKGGVIP